ncbi:MAG: hypothetical protein ACRDHV_05625 [Actinomycetota bacterium]
MSRQAITLLLLKAVLQGPIPSASAEETQADLAVQLAGPSGAVAVPNEAGITATVSNLGPMDASSVQLTLGLADGLEPMAVDQGAWTCTIDAAVTCVLATLLAGDVAAVDVTVAAVSSGSLPVSATISQSSADPNPENDTMTILVGASGRPCDSVGTAGPDTLEAKGRGNVACGLRGDDVILGGDGRQFLLGGSGRDALGGGRGHDRLDGGPGRDACAGKGRRCEVHDFASARSLPLYEIASATIGYGYHQSLFRTAVAMRPVAPHHVMASRRRGTGETTAVDIVIPSRSRIRSPVTGTVVAVERYLLYCRTRDWKVVLAPRSHPRLRVLVLHMARPAVGEGDEVRAGSTLLGRAARNDQPSAQANRYFPDRYPHVHIEVERNRASPTPGCTLGGSTASLRRRDPGGLEGTVREPPARVALAHCGLAPGHRGSSPRH